MKPAITSDVRSGTKHTMASDVRSGTKHTTASDMRSDTKHTIASAVRPDTNSFSPVPLAIALLIPLLTGAASALLSGPMSGMDDIQPSFAPPAALFPIVWTILYLLMGVSSWLIYRSEDPDKEKALSVYALQLFFNFFWSILFFRFSLYLPAFLWLLVLIVLILVMIRLFAGISPAAALLQIPYLLWCCFAAVLTFAIYRLN